MSEVMIDSWGLSDALFYELRELGYSHGLKRYYSNNRKRWNEILLSRQNLLTAIVLWDDIFVNSIPTNSIEQFDFPPHFLLKRVLGNHSFIHGIPMTDPTDPKINYFKRLAIYSKLVDAINDILGPTIDASNFYERTLLLRSGFYLVQAIDMKKTYLPHPLRAKVLYNAKIFKHEFDSSLYLDIIDSEVKKYIEAINELAQFQLLSTSFPVLYKFISQMAKNPLDEFNVALELRKDKNVILFKESVNSISEELRKGNIHALRASLMKTKEICDEITNSLYKKPLSYGVSLGVTPSIEISGNYTPKVSSSLHTTFLSELAEYAFKGKIPKRYMYGLW